MRWKGFVVGTRTSRLREAEFVSLSGAFPNEFRWEALLDCWKVQD
jgi:hypothetical protein